jgi:hypothetical protein
MVSLREREAIMKRTYLCVALCLIGLMVATSSLWQVAAADDGRKVGPLTRLLIEKGIIIRHELELEDAVYEPQELPTGFPVRHLGGIVTSLLIKKGIITQDEMIEAIQAAVKKGEVGTKGSPLVSLLVQKDVISENDGREVLATLGITLPEEPPPVVQKEPEPSVEEGPAAQEATVPVELEATEGVPAAQTVPAQERESAPVEKPQG